MPRTRTPSPPPGRQLGVQFPNADTIECWHAHPRDDRRAIVRVFRREKETGFWSEDRASQRTADRADWTSLQRRSDETLQQRERTHPLRSAIDGYDDASPIEGSLRLRMLLEILEEIRDAEITGDDDWLVSVWRQVAQHHEQRGGWVRSAGEAPLRRGPTRGAVQRQLLDAARSALLPLSGRSTFDKAERLSVLAAEELIRSVVGNFPIQVGSGFDSAPAERVLASEIYERWGHEKSEQFPSEDTLRWVVRRALVACGLPERVSYTFFHGEHEKAFRKRQTKPRATGTR